MRRACQGSAVVKHEYFQSLESLNRNDAIALKAFIDQLAFNEQGLIPVIALDAKSKDVLMLAWMNREALDITLDTGVMAYWSRSRNLLWVKGATSGNFQHLVSMRFDCDGDAILCLMRPEGPACHTGRGNCFYFETRDSQPSVTVISSTP